MILRMPEGDYVAIEGNGRLQGLKLALEVAEGKGLRVEVRG